MDISIILGVLAATMVDLLLIAAVVVAYGIASGEGAKRHCLVGGISMGLYTTLSTWLAVEVQNAAIFPHVVICVLAFAIDYLLILGFAGLFSKAKRRETTEKQS